MHEQILARASGVSVTACVCSTRSSLGHRWTNAITVCKARHRTADCGQLSKLRMFVCSLFTCVTFTLQFCVDSQVHSSLVNAVCISIGLIDQAEVYGLHSFVWIERIYWGGIFLIGILALYNRVIQIEHKPYEIETCSFKIIKEYWTQYLVASFWKLRLVRSVHCFQFTFEDNNWKNNCRSAVVILYQWSDEMSGEVLFHILAFWPTKYLF